MTTDEAAEVLGREVGNMIYQVDLATDPDCLVVRLMTCHRPPNTFRYIAISALPIAGLTIEELRPGHPTLLRLKLRQRLHPVPGDGGDAA